MTQQDARALLNKETDRWPTDAQALARLLAGRYSCRGYRDTPVPAATIERMLELAQLSASWCNSQPWQVIVTSGEGTERFRNALYAAAEVALQSGDSVSGSDADFAFPAAYTGAYRERRRDVGWQLYESVGVTAGDRSSSTRQMMQNFRLFDAPHALIITSERDLGVYGAIDCGLYVQALLLAAQSLGLGMIPQAALAAYAPLIRAHFGLPENRMVILGASFGYADPDHPANGFRSRRAGLGEVVRWVNE